MNANAHEAAASGRDRSRRSLRNYWVRPTVQIRFFLHSFGILTLAIGLGVSFAMLRVTSLSSLAETALALSQSADSYQYLVYVMSGSMVALGALALCGTAVFVHRVVGPLVPLERTIDQLIAGDYSARIILREKDEFQDLAAKLNALAEKLERSR